jgi:hypothetical protein
MEERPHPGIFKEARKGKKRDSSMEYLERNTVLPTPRELY